MDSSTLVTQVYKARNTLLAQLSEQGYDVSSLTGFSITEIGTMLKHDQLDFKVTREDGRNTYVKFHHAKALRPANVYDFVDQLFKSDDPILAPTDSLYIVANSDAEDTLTKSARFAVATRELIRCWSTRWQSFNTMHWNTLLCQSILY